MKPRHVIYAVLATLVIFASGVVTGGLLVRNVFPEKSATPPGSGWQMARLEQFQRAVNQLDLSPEQRAKVFRIARERQEYIADLMRIIEPDLPGLFIKMRHDINQVLTAEQRRELDQRWAQVQKKRFGLRSEMMGKTGEGGQAPLEPLPPTDGRRPLGPDGQPVPFRQNGQRLRPFPDRQPQNRPGGEKPVPENPPL
ncbi:MAG: hypothetical protein QOF48_2904 [Verrucomicrobiota bacterium]